MFKQIEVTGLKHTVSPSSRLILTADQIRRRRHALKVLEDVEEGTVCEVVSPIEFKQGEVLFTDQEVNKQQAVEISELGEDGDVEPEGEGDPEEMPLDEALEAMTLDQLREALDSREITYSPNAKEPNLRGKLKAAIEEEQGE